MSIFWHNRFNGIEEDGPFDTIDIAKADAVATYSHIQGGFAFDIVIKESGRIVAEGFIKKGIWNDGEFTETDEERIERCGA